MNIKKRFSMDRLIQTLMEYGVFARIERPASSEDKSPPQFLSGVMLVSQKSNHENVKLIRKNINVKNVLSWSKEEVLSRCDLFQSSGLSKTSFAQVWIELSQVIRAHRVKAKKSIKKRPGEDS